MSRRERRARENAARLKVAAARVLRRRARRSGGKPVATAAVAALAMAGFGVSTAAASTAGTVEPGPESIRGVGVGVGEGRLGQPVVQEPLLPLGAAGRRLERGGLRTESSGPSKLVDVGGTVFFTASDGIHGEELWRSDGTRTGTVRVKDINPGVDGSGPSSLTAVGGTLFFT